MEMDVNNQRTETTERTETNVTNSSHGHLMARRIIYFVLGFLEALFAFRLVFKILGAQPDSTFVSIIYSITNIFLAPFFGIFRSAVTQGIEVRSILEPQLLIAMVVYALIAWGIVKLIMILSAKNR